MTATYYRVIFFVDATREDEVFDLAYETSARGSALFSRDKLAGDDPPPEGMLRAEFFFSKESDALAAAEAVRALDGGLVPRVVAEEPKDWVAESRSHFRPIECAKGLWVSPPWTRVAEGELLSGTEIVIDPGLAFGTGQHPTTRMCLAALDHALTVQGAGAARVMDVGTGSGVLAILAALRGAKLVHAVDNDPLAVQATRENLVRNGVAASEGEVPEWFRLEEGLLSETMGPFTIVVANILLMPLVEIAGLIYRVTEPSGIVILSGILETQIDELAAAYRKVGFVERERAIEEDWAALVLSR